MVYDGLDFVCLDPGLEFLVISMTQHLLAIAVSKLRRNSLSLKRATDEPSSIIMILITILNGITLFSIIIASTGASIGLKKNTSETVWWEELTENL